MDFAIMVWSSANVQASSIYGVLDKASPGQLPNISDKGNWVDLKTTVPEDRFNDAASAKKSIADVGYYLIGGTMNFTIA